MNEWLLPINPRNPGVKLSIWRAFPLRNITFLYIIMRIPWLDYLEVLPLDLNPQIQVVPEGAAAINESGLPSQQGTALTGFKIRHSTPSQWNPLG